METWASWPFSSSRSWSVCLSHTITDWSSDPETIFALSELIARTVLHQNQKLKIKKKEALLKKRKLTKSHNSWEVSSRIRNMYPVCPFRVARSSEPRRLGSQILTCTNSGSNQKRILGCCYSFWICTKLRLNLSEFQEMKQWKTILFDYTIITLSEKKYHTDYCSSSISAYLFFQIFHLLYSQLR